MRFPILRLLAPALLIGPGAAQQRVLTAADYARAERVHEANVAALVDRNRPSWRWSEDGRTLFYRINERAGPRAYRIDPATGTRIEIASIDPTKSDTAPASDTLPAPGGGQALFVREHNLWLRMAGGAERRLTNDGVADFAYGVPPDFLYTAITRLSGGPVGPPAFVAWSPDGRWLFGKRFDQRRVHPYPYVAWTPADGEVRPRLYLPRQALVGDPEQAIEQLYLVDAAAGRVREAARLPGWTIDPTSIIWSKAGDRAWLLATAETGNGGALIAFDPVTMALRPVIEEKRRGFFFFNAGSLYTAANVRILGDGREALWFSSRDGWGNLFLYDLRTGRMKRQLTRGPGVVLDIVAVDEPGRRVFFTGGGRRGDGDPYQRQLYTVSLDGGPARALTDDDRDHEIAGPVAPFFRPFFRAPPGVDAVSPDFRWFVDTASRLDSAPVVTLRPIYPQRGRALELDRADTARFVAAGGRPPERFRVKAADGVTDIWGAIWLPPGYDAAGRYPVIDGIYAGPQVIVAPRTWNEGTGARAQMYDRNSLAALGFIIVTIDGRGTPGRSAAFQDVGYGNFADPQLDDHVAALRQLARRYAGMDLTRVGAYGHSLGGYTSARALLRHPDIYKVAVSSAGVYAWERFAPSYRAVFGEPDYGAGRTVRPDGTSVPGNYAAVNNTALADRLQGKLLLVAGDLDENAPAGQAMAMVDALTRAGKPYDLMLLPNTTHRYGALNYFTARLWGYFAEHLLGASPPADYSFGSAAATAAAAAGPANPRSVAPSPEAVEAVRRVAVPLGAASAPLSPAEAAALRRVTAGARIIGFGEVGHGMREPLEHRNRLIRHLVEQEGLTAVAIESGLANTRAVGDWVLGSAGDPAALLRDNLSWNFGDLQANLDLVRWLRAWNQAHPTRTVRFYGLDASTKIAVVDGKPELDGAVALPPLLAYLAHAAPTRSADLSSDLRAIGPDLRSDRFRALDPLGRARIERVLTRADAWLHRERGTLLRASDQGAFDWAKRLVWDLRHLPGLLAGWTTDPREMAKIMASIDARDFAMAEHARWLLAREGPRGRLLAFAANGHVSAAPMVGSVMRQFPRQPKVMGTWLREGMGGGYRAILSASPHGKGGSDHRLGSIDRALVEAAQTAAFLTVRGTPPGGWWSRTHTLAQGAGRLDELVPLKASDGLLVLPALTDAPTSR